MPPILIEIIKAVWRTEECDCGSVVGGSFGGVFTSPCVRHEQLYVMSENSEKSLM